MPVVEPAQGHPELESACPVPIAATEIGGEGENQLKTGASASWYSKNWTALRKDIPAEGTLAIGKCLIVRTSVSLATFTFSVIITIF